MTDNGVDDETYSVIYAALKHPIRRRILRMLDEKELTYTQMLTTLDLDTGHLNYHLESLAELLAKTSESKYRLTEFGKAAVMLMKNIEETDTPPNKKVKIKFSKKKMLFLSHIVAIIALVLVGFFLMNISYVSVYHNGTISNADPIIIPPNGSSYGLEYINIRSFHLNTLTTHYREYYQVDIDDANVTLQVQVLESIFPQGNIPASAGESEQTWKKYYQNPEMVYNETHYSRPLYPEKIAEEKHSRVSYTIEFPLVDPHDKDLSFSNSFAVYNTTLINMGGRLVQNSSSFERYVDWPNNTGYLDKVTTSMLTERTDYPYFYYGIALIVLSAVVALLPILPMVKKKIKKK